MNLLIFCWAILLAAQLPANAAEAVPSSTPEGPRSEKQKIEALITYIEALTNANFIRNGIHYDAKTAARFLRGKWHRDEKRIKTAADFIERVGTESSTTRKPYKIRLKDGREVRCADYLKNVLKKQEQEPVGRTVRRQIRGGRQPEPRDEGEPVGGSVPEGGNFTFSVVVSGSQPRSFQWLKDSVVIPRASSQDFTLINLKSIDSGGYQAAASNAYGRATSQVARLFVGPGGSGSNLSLTDDFNDSLTDADKWIQGTLSLYEGSSLTDSSVPVLEEKSIDNNGYLKIVPKEGVPGLHYNGYISKNKYDFSGGQLSVEIVQIPNPSSTAEMFVSVGLDGNNLYRFEIHKGQLRADFIANGIPTYTVLGAYNADHKYLRIRDDASRNLIFWEASSDRMHWSTVYTRLSAFAVTNVQVELFAGTYTPANSPGIAIFDDVEFSKVAVPTNQAPYLLTQPQDATNVVEGGSAIFTVFAGGTEPLTYQWIKESQVIVGETASTLSLFDVRRSKGLEGAYQVIIRNLYGSITSNPAMLRLGSAGAPVIVSSGGFRELQAGLSLTLSYFILSAPPISYQWFKNGDAIPGATQAELRIASATVNDAGEYRLRVSNPYGTTMGPADTLIVTGRTTGPPLIESQPPAWVTIRKGEPLNLSVVVNGEAPFQYKWLKDSRELPQAASTTLAIPASQLSDTGIYQFIAVNSRGSALSEKISVLVLGTGPVITLQPPERTVLFPGESAYLQIDLRASDSPTVSWYHNGQKQSERFILNSTFESTRFLDALGLFGWGGFHRVIAAEEEGDWFAVATDSTGSTTSTVAHVEVILPLPKRPPSSGTPDLRNDLVAYWPLDQANNGKTKDLVGHYDLELNKVSFAQARNQGGIQFSYAETNQTATYYATGLDDELPINQHPAFSISLWTKLTPYQNHVSLQVPYLFREGDTEKTNTVFALMPDYRNGYDAELWALFRFVQPPRENVEIGANRPVFAANDWRHLVFVQEEDGKRWLYIDGVEADIDLPPKPPGAWKLNYTQIGGSEALRVPDLSAMTFFCCFPHVVTIDDVAVWKRALSAEEIRLLMDEGIPGFERKRVAIQSLALDRAAGSVNLTWTAGGEGEGSYTLLKSSTVRGPWNVVTVHYPWESYAITNSFTDVLTSQREVFYQIQHTPMAP